MIAGFPVTARANDSASMVASVPELQKRTRSIDGNRSQIAAASSDSYRLGAPKTNPSSSASRIASTITGCECP